MLYASLSKQQQGFLLIFVTFFKHNVFCYFNFYVFTSLLLYVQERRKL